MDTTAPIPPNPIVAWYEAINARLRDGEPVKQKDLADESKISPSYISGCQRPADHRAPRVPELPNRLKLHEAALAIERRLQEQGRLRGRKAIGGIPPESWDAFKAAIPDRRKEAGALRRKRQPARDVEPAAA